MNPVPEEPSDDASALDAILAEYMQRLDRGESIDRDAVLIAHPEFGDELRELFAAADRVEHMAGPTSEVTIDSDHAVSAVSPIDTIRYFGDYELLSEIARGGMGVVYKARQVSLNRIVAVKMILAGQLASPVDVDRFHAEAEAAANLDHPGIVPIYEVGHHNGQHYFSMGYVDGQSLAARVTSGPLPPREAATLVATVAEVVQYAHQRGVIHRDLKPANILLDHAGTPRVTDFGLAKRTQSDSSLTATGQIVGTPSFMAPEQARGEQGEINPAIDVYALGAILYALLTGRPPFQAATIVDTLLQVREQDPVPPRQLDPSIPRDLETIALKCLEKDPKRRYETAAELTAELRRCLSGRPIQARPVGRAERLWRWAKRQPVVAGLSATLVVVLLSVAVIGLITTAYQASLRADAEGLVDRLDESLGKQRTATADADRRRQQAQYQAARVKFEQGWTKYEQGSAVEGLAFVGAALADVDGQDREADAALVNPVTESFARSLRNHLLYISLAPNCPRMSLTHDGGVFAVAFSPDGTKLATGSDDKTARLWDIATGKPVGEPLQHGAMVRSVTFNRDGTKLATASDDKTARIWDVATCKQLGESLRHPKDVVSAVFNPNATKLATVSEDKIVRLWDVATGKPLGEPLAKQGQVLSVNFSPDGTKMAVASRDKTARLWVVATNKPLGEPLQHDDEVSSVVFSPDGTILATASDNTVRLWDVVTGKPLEIQFKHEGSVESFVWSPDGEKLATAGSYSAQLWDVKTGTPLGAPVRHQGPVLSVAISPDGALLATASVDKTARLWNVVAGEPREEALPNESGFNWFVVSPDGTKLAATGTEKSARLWDLATGDVLFELEQLEYVALFSPEGTKLATTKLTASVDDGMVVRLRDVTTGRVLSEFKRQNTVMAFSRDGTKLATLPEANLVHLWDATTGKPLGRPMRHDAPVVVSLAFSPDGAKLVTLCYDNKARLWDVATGDSLGELENQVAISKAVFSPDGTKLVTASPEKTARLWDVATGKLLSKFEHQFFVMQVAFSPDGTKLLTASLERMVRLWDVATGKPIGEPLPLQGQVLSVAFSPDGTKFVTVIMDNTTQLWDVATSRPLGLPLSHEGQIVAVAFSPDGTKLLATMSAKKAVRAWEVDLPPQEKADHMVLWTATITGLELNETGVVRILSPEESADRRIRLDHAGGPPKSYLKALARRRAAQSPILRAPEP